MLQMLFSNIVDVVFKCCEILFMLLATSACSVGWWLMAGAGLF
jgi:hypothetical protein